MIGKTLGHYKVLEQVGVGGMGEVYRAHDTRLRRDVAIKVIPPRLLGDEEHQLRFEREARLLASLNHPHIAAIYGLEHHEDQFFLVLEFVPGADLSLRLTRGPLPLDESLRIARQVAEALEYAHRQGVIHRDLKPGNIALTADGNVKVLDFGLAKALDPGVQAEPGTLSQSPTLLSGGSAANVLLGTAAYMSPEQARGNPVDSRADVWAFGCVVMECLTGRMLFEGDSISDTLAAVLRDEIDWSRLPVETPPALRRLLRRCLERDPARRLHSLADARLELEDAGEELRRGPGRAPAAVTSGKRWVTWLPWALAAVLGLVLVGTLLTRSTTVLPPSRTVRFTVSVDSLDSSGLCPPAISPDGTRLAYLAAGRLWVRSLSSLEAEPLPDTEEARAVFWSPDGASIGFQAQGRLWRVSADGGRPVAICDAPEAPGTAGSAAWSEDGRIVFASGGGSILQVNVAGGNAVSLLDPDPDKDDDFHSPSLLPEGKGVIFVPHRLGGKFNEIELLHEGTRRVLWEHPGEGTVHNPKYAQGHILFRSDEPDQGIWAIPFSLEKLRVTADRFLVADRAEAPSVSKDGTLIYAGGALQAHRLVLVDTEGNIESQAIDQGRHIDDTAFSPSGKQLLETRVEGSHNTIQVRDLVRDATSVIASGTGVQNPFWISETSIGVMHTDSTQLVVHDLQRPGPPRVIFQGNGAGVFQGQTGSVSVARDGGYVLFELYAATTKSDLWITALDGSSEASPLLATSAEESDPRVSPVADLLVYVSDESGRPEVYLSRLDVRGATIPSRRWQVSSNAGTFPQWSRDGERLYYVSAGRFMEVEVQDGEDIVLSPPRELFGLIPRNLQLNHGYCVHPEGRKFLMVQVGDPSEPLNDIVVVQNWLAEFRGH